MWLLLSSVVLSFIAANVFLPREGVLLSSLRMHVGCASSSSVVQCELIVILLPIIDTFKHTHAVFILPPMWVVEECNQELCIT